MTLEQENIFDEMYTSIAIAKKIAFETDNAIAGYIEQVCVIEEPELEKYVFNAKKISAALKKDMPMRVNGHKNKEFTNDDFKGMRCSRYYCPNCNGSLRRGIRYCDKCGQKLSFPVFSWSPYREGEKQERFMKWSDEDEN